MILFSIATFAQVGIGTDTPDGSAKLDVKSTDKGFLPPRLTTAQRDQINLPAAGLMIYNTTIGAIQFYTGSSWITANSALSDTSLLNLTTRFSQINTNLDNKLNRSDTSNMLLGYLRKSDTSSLSNRINAKLSSGDFPSGSAVGNLMYWDVTRWVILAPGAEGQVLTMSSGLPVWRTSATSAFTCETIISDIDDNSYNTILIGTQC